MKRTGFTDLRLCSGPVPHYKELKELARSIIKLLVREVGLKETVKRFSDPFWYQCLATTLGFEHNYSGATTVVLKAIKEICIEENLPIKIAGGKGNEAINALEDIEKISDEFSFNSKLEEKLKLSSKLSAKFDNSLIQDSFSIYFHSIIVSEKGDFAIINQGMNEKEGLVRRYHWSNLEDPFRENHSGVSISDKIVLNLGDKNIEETRKTMLDLVKDHNPKQLNYKIIQLNKSLKYNSLTEYVQNCEDKKIIIKKLPYYLYFPKKLNEKALQIARDADSFKEMVLTNGMGPSTLRGLAFISSLIYGTPLSWRDPQLYCYAHGTKAGKPWKVEKKLMLENAKFLESIIKENVEDSRKRKKLLINLSKIVEKYSN